MSLVGKLKRQLKSIALTTAYFGAWIGTLILLKTLVLQQYHIGFVGWSKVLGGAMVLGRVVRILERVTFGSWVRARAAWVDVVLRTALYSVALAVFLVLDGGIEGWREHGGFVQALEAMRQDASIPHIVANSICLSGAFLVYNALAVLRRHLGGSKLWRLFLQPLPDAEPARPHGTDGE